MGGLGYGGVAVWRTCGVWQLPCVRVAVCKSCIVGESHHVEVVVCAVFEGRGVQELRCLGIAV